MCCKDSTALIGICFVDDTSTEEYRTPAKGTNANPDCLPCCMWKDCLPLCDYHLEPLEE
jgi:hypothetical protein